VGVWAAKQTKVGGSGRHAITCGRRLAQTPHNQAGDSSSAAHYPNARGAGCRSCLCVDFALAQATRTGSGHPPADASRERRVLSDAALSRNDPATVALGDTQHAACATTRGAVAHASAPSPASARRSCVAGIRGRASPLASRHTP